MIVVATDDFEVYHGVVGELRDRGVTFTTVEADAPLPAATEVLLTAADEDREPVVDREDGSTTSVPVVRADPDDPRHAVEEVVAILRGGGGRTVVGIDPGERPGIAVLVGGTVVAAFNVPEAEAADLVAREIEEATNPLVRIGDGARLAGGRIVDDLPNVPVQLVDETGTTPYLGSGARGMGDVLAAVNIARIDGEAIETRRIDPTSGELTRIKDRSRERSETNRAIDEALARQVALGELSLDEALEEHREG